MGMNFNLDGTTDAWAEHKRKQMEAAKKADMEKKKEEESSYNEVFGILRNKSLFNR